MQSIKDLIVERYNIQYCDDVKISKKSKKNYLFDESNAVYFKIIHNMGLREMNFFWYEHGPHTINKNDINIIYKGIGLSEKEINDDASAQWFKKNGLSHIKGYEFNGLLNKKRIMGVSSKLSYDDLLPCGIDPIYDNDIVKNDKIRAKQQLLFDTNKVRIALPMKDNGVDLILYIHEWIMRLMHVPEFIHFTIKRIAFPFVSTVSKFYEIDFGFENCNHYLVMACTLPNVLREYFFDSFEDYERADELDASNLAEESFQSAYWVKEFLRNDELDSKVRKIISSETKRKNGSVKNVFAEVKKLQKITTIVEENIKNKFSKSRKK